MDRFAARGGWWVVTQAALLVGFALVLVLGGPVAAPSGLRWALRGAGLACLGLAAWLAAGGLRALGPGLTPYPEPKDGAALVVTGVYRAVRHPLYGAVTLACAGAALIGLSPGAGLVALALTGFFLAKAAHEERRLAAAYPGYEAYRRCVPHRLIPWLL